MDISSKQEQILSFWFGKLENSYEWDRQKSSLWFNGNEELDRMIHDAFADDILKAASGVYREWEKTPRGNLALIILLDQFPRNVFRGTPQAYQFAHLAERCSREGIEKGLDQELYPIERQFFYLPLMHSENIENQELSLRVFKQLTEEADEANQAYFYSAEDYAKNHFKIVKTYGRFPHRNAILDRSSTDAEIEYLKQSTASYGQVSASPK